MGMTLQQGDSKEALNRRLDAIGWGLFLITIGVLWLAPQGVVPEGTWLIAAGAILLGVNLARYLNAIKLSGTSLLLGLLAIVFGVGEFFGLQLPFVAILLIIFGAGLYRRQSNTRHLAYPMEAAWRAHSPYVVLYRSAPRVMPKSRTAGRCLKPDA